MSTSTIPKFMPQHLQRKLKKWCSDPMVQKDNPKMPRGLGNVPKLNCCATHPHRNRLAWSWVDERLGLVRQQRKNPKLATKRHPPVGLIISRMVLLKVAGVAPKYHLIIAWSTSLLLPAQE